VVVNGDGENLLGKVLADDVLIERSDQFTRRGNPVKEWFGRAAAALFLVEDRLTEFDALAADIYVARPFNEWPDVAIALSTK
jgi:hypothetical protein